METSISLEPSEVLWRIEDKSYNFKYKLSIFAFWVVILALLAGVLWGATETITIRSVVSGILLYIALFRIGPGKVAEYFLLQYITSPEGESMREQFLKDGRLKEL